MDVGTLGDRISPVGLTWYYTRTRRKGSGRGIQAVNSALSVSTVLLCSVCDDGSNPCRYDGDCVDGQCQCSLGSEGAVCEQVRRD